MSPTSYYPVRDGGQWRLAHRRSEVYEAIFADERFPTEEAAWGFIAEMLETRGQVSGAGRQRAAGERPDLEARLEVAHAMGETRAARAAFWQQFYGLSPQRPLPRYRRVLRDLQRGVRQAVALKLAPWLED